MTQSHVAAFFDLDDTLVRFNTALEWARNLRRNKEISMFDLVRGTMWAFQHRLAILDMQDLMIRLVQRLEGTREQELLDRTKEFIEQSVGPLILSDAQEIIARHRLQGHTLILLSSTLSYIGEAVAQHLQFDAALCTSVEVQDSTLTGQCVLPICYGPGKVYYATEFARANGIFLDESYFYTDSYTDLPFLLEVGHPCAVNPDRRLEWYATRHSWPILRWT